MDADEFIREWDAAAERNDVACVDELRRMTPTS